MADEDKNADVEALKAQVAELTKGIEALKSKNDELLTETKAAKAARREAEDRAKAEAEELAKKSGNFDAYKKSVDEKSAKEIAQLRETLESEIASNRKSIAEREAMAIASAIAVPNSESLLMPHILSRISVDREDERYVVRVLGLDGKPSAASLDDLKTEFTTSPAFAPVIVGSKASGGGANGSSNGGGAAQPQGDLGGTPEQRRAAIAAKLKASGF